MARSLRNFLQRQRIRLRRRCRYLSEVFNIAATEGMFKEMLGNGGRPSPIAATDGLAEGEREAIRALCADVEALRKEAGGK
jgi:hypothetical protein